MEKPSAAMRRSAHILDEAEAAIEGLLEWAERHVQGDPSLDPEEYYAIRDYARVILKKMEAL